MKLGMVNTLEYCICCNMTKQCLKEGIPQHKALHPTGRYTSITVQHSKKPKQKIMIMKLGMVNTLEHCICCNMTKQCLKEGIPHLSIKLYTQLAYTSITVQHSKKPKQKIMIMKLGMVTTLEHCICCNMTKQCLKEGILLGNSFNRKCEAISPKRKCVTRDVG